MVFNVTMPHSSIICILCNYWMKVESVVWDKVGWWLSKFVVFFIKPVKISIGSEHVSEYASLHARLAMEWDKESQPCMRFPKKHLKSSSRLRYLCKYLSDLSYELAAPVEANPYLSFSRSPVQGQINNDQVWRHYGWWPANRVKRASVGHPVNLIPWMGPAVYRVNRVRPPTIWCGCLCVCVRIAKGRSVIGEYRPG